MSRKVTIQQIADSLGLSRNTVSKALNNTGVLAENTRSRIIARAKEMGYKQFVLMQEDHPVESETATREIALFSSSVMGGSHFSAALLDAFQKKISRKGINLSIYAIRKEELTALTLPLNFRRETTIGIIAIELFDEAYSQFICAQGIPSLFVDTATNLSGFSLASDILLMENRNSTYAMTKSVIDQGKRHITFVGDRHHCQSFYERWCGFSDAMMRSEIPSPLENHILDDDDCPYEDVLWMVDKIKSLPQLPDAFCCANDFQAINVFRALRHLGLSVPDDVLLYGFDDAMEAQIMDPALTTARIPGSSMGYIASELLLSRIKYPDTAYRTTYIQTEVIHRRSTQAK